MVLSDTDLMARKRFRDLLKQLGGAMLGRMRAADFKVSTAPSQHIPSNRMTNVKRVEVCGLSGCIHETHAFMKLQVNPYVLEFRFRFIQRVRARDAVPKDPCDA